MTIPSLFPQPFKEFLVNYNHLKELLHFLPKDDLEVRKTAFKVSLTGLHCFFGVLLASLYIETFPYSIPNIISNFAFASIIVLNLNLAVATASLTCGIVASATIINAIAMRSWPLLVTGLMFGIAHYGIGQVYHNLLQLRWEQLENPANSQRTGWGVLMDNCSQAIDLVINRVSRNITI